MANEALDRYITGNYGANQTDITDDRFDPLLRATDALSDIRARAQSLARHPTIKRNTDLASIIELLLGDADGALSDIESGHDTRED